MLLIIASKIDPHADAVIDELRPHNVSFMRIDLESVYYDYDVSITPCAGGIQWTIKDKVLPRTISDKTVKTVWWRRGNSYPNGRPTLTKERVEEEETRNVVKWLLENIPPERFPFGHPYKIRSAENKVLQMDAAVTSGFVIPDYLFTNEHKKIIDFFTANQDAVVKSLTLAAYIDNGKNYAFKAIRMTKADFEENERKEGVESVAAFVQKNVKRSYDIRAFVHNSFSHACKIYVNNLPNGAIDWRPHIGSCFHEKHILSNETILKCLKYLSKIDMPCGHFDFIVDNSGKEMFLECNPNGQWYWLEKMAGCKIASDVSDVLITHYRQ